MAKPKKKKANLQRELLQVSKKHLKVSEQHRGISGEHRDIGRQQLRQSMSLREKRAWQLVGILTMIIIGGGIIINLNPFEKEITLDYAVAVEVTPNQVKLNEDSKIEFSFKFTNVGRKNITDFKVLGLELYRIENNENVFHGQLISPLDGRVDMNCDVGYSGNQLPVGKSCTLKEEMYSCPKCFDDKDKTVQFYIYIESVPPIDNKIVNLSIY